MKNRTPKLVRTPVLPLFTFAVTMLARLASALNGQEQEKHEQPKQAPRPNVILVMADDLGWGDPQCFNSNSPIKTPNIDAMAANGLKFHRFYSAAPVCSPTRGSCLTGRHPYRYGIYSANVGHLKADELTLPEALKEIGYTTGHFGKWHLGTLTKEFPDANRGGPKNKEHFAPPSEHGYDISLATESKVPTYDPLFQPRNAPSTAWDALTTNDDSIPYGTRYWDESGQNIEGLKGDDSKIIMEAALKFITNAVNREQPFFTTIWFHAPHLPVVADPNYAKLYSDYDTYHRNYFGCITALDAQIGRLREQLRNQGIAENTMIWFCSDNGPEGKASNSPGSAGHFRGRKRDLYEGGVRVPGIVEWPGKIRPQTTDFPAVTSDYLPTVFDFLEIPIPDKPIDGISLRPLIEQSTNTRNIPIFFQSAKQLSMVTDQYKLISVNQGKTWQLYDLTNDAEETRDLIDDFPEEAAKMKNELEAWVESCRERNP